MTVLIIIVAAVLVLLLGLAALAFRHGDLRDRPDEMPARPDLPS